MKKRITLLFSCFALCCTPLFSQVATSIDNDNGIDSLEGFQADIALKATGEAHDAFEAENQLRIAKRNYIDEKFQIGRYAPEYAALHSQLNNPNTPQTACSNVNFESGDFTSWTGAIGDNMISNAGPLSNITPGFFTVGNNAAISNSNARHTIITAAYGNDPYGGFPGVPVGSGNYTVRMGGQTPNYQGEIMEQTFVVSPTSTSFAYRYAVVLNDPQTGHGYTDKPYFKIEVLDQNGQPISPCTQYFVVADATTLQGFTLSPLSPPTGGVAYYKPWTDVNFDLSGYVNQNITVRFTVAGCTQSGHFGYCYFDCSCSSFAANVHFCPGNTFLYLNAPVGYGTYQWFDQNHNPIPGAIYDTLFVNNPTVGDTFFVYLVSGVDTSCHNILPVVLQYTNILPNATTADPSCWGFNDGTATANGTVGYPPYTYEWLTTPIQMSQTITGLSPGPYVIHMTDSLGCDAYDTVMVNETPRRDTSMVSYHYCPNNPDVIFYAPAGYSSYAWTDPLGNPMVGDSVVIISNPVVGSEYNCVLIPFTGCPLYDSVIVPVLQWTDVLPNATAAGTSCWGYNDGSAATSIALGVAPYTYSWNTSPVQTSPSASNLSAGTYIVHVVDSMGCEGYDTVVVVQPTRLDTAMVSYHYCPNNPNVIFYAPPGYSNYAWTDPNGNPITGGSTVILTSPVVGSEYNCILTPATGCPVYDSVIIPPLQWIDVLPNASVTGVSCYGYTNGTAAAAGTLGISPYTYNWNTSPAQTTPAINNLSAGTYIVHVLDSMGCEGYDTVVVTQPARLDTSLFNYEYCYGDPHMTMYAPPGYSFYTWIGPGNDTLAFNSSDNSILLSNPSIGQEYLCILHSPPGCPIYDTTVLAFTPPSYFFNPDSVVNVFTPNGDLLNDIFYPYYDYSVSRQTAVAGQPAYDFFDLHVLSYEVWVYDRWGKEVFYSSDYKFGWDGTVKQGKDCTDGVYYWVAKMTSSCSNDQTPIISKGFVHLIR